MAKLNQASYQRLDLTEPPCDGFAVDRPYESANYQINAPIYYFNGTDDPATPHDLAQDHYDNQRNSSNKEFVSVRHGGHNPIYLKLRDCQDDIWQDIFAGRSAKQNIDNDGFCRNTNLWQENQFELPPSIRQNPHRAYLFHHM